MNSRTIFKATLVVLLTLLAAYFLFSSVRILMVLTIAILLATSVRPLVQVLMKWRIPEGFAIVLVYIGILATIALIFLAILPPIINQFIAYIEDDNRLTQRIIITQSFFVRLAQDFNEYASPIMSAEEIRVNVGEFIQQIRNSTPSFLNNLGAILGDTILMFVMGVYWLTSHDKAIDFITSISPRQHKSAIPELITNIESLMGSYVRGNFLIGSIVALLNYIPMAIFDVPNAMLIALLIGITTTIPMVGGVIGGLIAIMLTLLVSTSHVIPVLVIVLIVQQIENHILSPRIMGNTVGLDPLLVIIYTAIGFVTGGVLGALLAVPVMASMHVLFEYFILTPYKQEISDFERQESANFDKEDEEDKKYPKEHDKIILVEKPRKIVPEPQTD